MIETKTVVYPFGTSNRYYVLMCWKCSYRWISVDNSNDFGLIFKDGETHSVVCLDVNLLSSAHIIPILIKRKRPSKALRYSAEESKDGEVNGRSLPIFHPEIKVRARGVEVTYFIYSFARARILAAYFCLVGNHACICQQDYVRGVPVGVRCVEAHVDQ